MCLRFLEFRSDWSNIGAASEIVYWPRRAGVAREPFIFEDDAWEPIIGL